MEIRLNGWVRLWVLLSLCWLSIVVGKAYADYRDIIKEKTAIYEITNPNDKNIKKKIKIVFSASIPENEIKRQSEEEIIPNLMSGDFNSIQDKYPEPYTSVVKNSHNKSILYFIKYGISPSIIILLLGLGVFWVIKGFKK